MSATVAPVPDEESAELSESAIIAGLQQMVSPSRLTLFLQCRLKFWFRYVARMAKPKSAALHVGVSYGVRMAAIQELLPRPDPHLPVAETAVGITAKVEMLQRLRVAEREGIVLRKVNGISRRGDSAVDGCVWQCGFPKSRPASAEAVSPAETKRVSATPENNQP